MNPSDAQYGPEAPAAGGGVGAPLTPDSGFDLPLTGTNLDLWLIVGMYLLVVGLVIYRLGARRA